MYDMAYVVAYAGRHHRKALQFSYTAAASSYCSFFESVWMVPGTFEDE